MSDPTFTRPTRRDNANKEERLDILRMLETGTITADEAGRLLDALDRSDRSGPPDPEDPTRPIGGRARNVRIRVTDSSGKATVNVVLPAGLIDAGLRIAGRFAPDRIADAGVIRDALMSGFRGPVVEVNENGQRVEITIE